MKTTAKPFRFAPLVILISGLCTSCTVSDYFNASANVDPKESINVEQANQQIAEAKAAEQARIALEKQQQAEAQAMQLLANQPVQFLPTLAKIYAARDFAPIWQDDAAKKKFLHEYAAFVASGISRSAATELESISATPVDDIKHDMLVTDAFLGYMHYTQKVPNSAQSWLYSQNSYKSDKPTDESIDKWLSAVQNNQHSEFVNQIASKNHLYQETLQRIASNLATGKVKSNAELYKLALNAQRLRIIPSFDNGIFVNIPSYQLNYYRDGNLVLNSRVIVGKPARKTPVMYSKLSNVVVNPPWSVPSTILSKDLVPKLARDPGYADRASLEIFDGSGNKVSAYNVNWSQYVNKKGIPYRIRQKAGDNSALGRFKFNMPSSDAIYLHDTPNHSLFSKTDRALSSGCVRVSKSDELASILLKEAGWTMDKKQRVLTSKKTTSVPIQSSNPVYLYYVTTWVENGKVQTAPDIYGYDGKLSAPSYINWTTVQKYL
ncbi:L,D-transpeptidase family protein [Lonepinella sp. BR2474]|uniref:L,D-transpeptidase family protein n=1 Tax=Lonepinella sp. BR2474 TaxID=3434548 RepID=UPI003F6DC91F